MQSTEQGGIQRNAKQEWSRTGFALFQACPISLCIESPPSSFVTLSSEFPEATKAMRAVKTINKAALKSVDLNLKQPGDLHVTDMKDRAFACDRYGHWAMLRS